MSGIQQEVIAISENENYLLIIFFWTVQNPIFFHYPFVKSKLFKLLNETVMLLETKSHDILHILSLKDGSLDKLREELRAKSLFPFNWMLQEIR